MKYFLIMFVLFTNFYSIAQGPTYSISTTNQIKNFKYVFTYSKSYIYDEDFEINKNYHYGEAKFLIEINENGTGRLVTLLDNGTQFMAKKSYKIYSCYQKSYKNSTSKYWEITAESSITGGTFDTKDTYCLDIIDNTFKDFWIWWKSSKTRMYFTN